MQIGAGNFCLNTYAIATSYVNIIDDIVINARCNEK